MNERALKKKLVIKRKSIKNKLALLKYGESEQDKMYNPITKHLKTIENKIESKKNPSRENQTKIEFDNYDDYDEYKTLKKIKKKEHDLLDETKYEDFDVDEDVSLEEKNKKLDEYNAYLEQLNPLPKKYIVGLNNDDSANENYDMKYGVRHETNSDKLLIGDSVLVIDGNDILVKQKKYRGSVGLFELLFKKMPDSNLYSAEDVKNYQQIVQKTNAHRRHYNAHKQIDGSKSYKYKTFIAPMLATSTGKGLLMEATKNKIDYVYFDDINEIVEKLRLLIASRNAGHTGHRNEINSIIEELKEANIIE